MKKIKHQVLNAKYHQKEAEIVANAGFSGSVTIATNMAGRGTDIKLGEGVKEAGGLAIIGTERHDSRRVDRQLRGRSGRQGDPGSSKFFVSLEDDLMRMFGSDKIAKVMDRFGLKEGEVIEANMVTRSIERAQKKVEENNFGIRKRLLEYDDVMNAQRKAIYKKRRNALFGERLDIDIDNMYYELCHNTVHNLFDQEYREFNNELLRQIGIDAPFNEEEYKGLTELDKTEKIYESMKESYNRKTKNISEKAFPQIKHVHETMAGKYKNIVFPLSDGKKEMRLIVNLEEAYNSKGSTISNSLEKNVILSTIDNEWKEHLREMDDLRSAVNNATYEQKDPLLIYKLESFELFKAMIDRFNKESVESLMKLNIPIEQEIESTNKENKQDNYSKANSQNSSNSLPPFRNDSDYQKAIQNSMQNEVKREPIITEKKVGRNEKVKIKNLTSGEIKEMKYKHAEKYLTNSEWIISDNN